MQVFKNIFIPILTIVSSEAGEYADCIYAGDK